MNLVMKRSNADAVLYKMLLLLKIPVTYAQIVTELNLHPNYPSLLSLNDVLARFDITADAYDVGFDDLHQVSVPFIAHTSKGDSEFVLVKKAFGDFYIVDNGSVVSEKIEREEFGKIYNGVVLVAEAVRPETHKEKRWSTLQDLINIVEFPAKLVLFFIILLSATLLNTSYLDNLSVQSALATIFKFIGLTTSIVLLSHSIDNNNQLVQKICGGQNMDCNAILNSRASLVYRGLSWSDIGFFYFAGTLCTLLMVKNTTSVMQILAILNVISLPYTVYSIYYQLKIAGKWCLLCCTVQAILWLEFAPLITAFKHPLTFPDPTQSFNIFIALSIPALLWLIVKPVLKELQLVGPLKYQLREFKYNNDFFNRMISSQPKYPSPDKEWSITLGNPEAANIISVISNPYCQPCSLIHEELDGLLKYRTDLQLRIVFSVNNLEGDPLTAVARHLMALNNKQNNPEISNAMSFWYSQDNKNFPQFVERYPVVIDARVITQIDEQKQWCKLIDVKATPTLLINGHPLPKIYQLNDLKYMLI